MPQLHNRVSLTLLNDPLSLLLPTCTSVHPSVVQLEQTGSSPVAKHVAQFYYYGTTRRASDRSRILADRERATRSNEEREGDRGSAAGGPRCTPSPGRVYRRPGQARTPACADEAAAQRRVSHGASARHCDGSWPTPLTEPPSPDPAPHERDRASAVPMSCGNVAAAAASAYVLSMAADERNAAKRTAAALMLTAAGFAAAATAVTSSALADPEKAQVRAAP
eukprot:SAG31_NODE_886_length_11229_cov_19.134142_3_plen_222_part_00